MAACSQNGLAFFFEWEMRKLLNLSWFLSCMLVRISDLTIQCMPVPFRMGVELDGFAIEKLIGLQYGQDYTCISTVFVSCSYPTGQLQEAFSITIETTQ